MSKGNIQKEISKKESVIKVKFEIHYNWGKEISKKESVIKVKFEIHTEENKNINIIKMTCLKNSKLGIHSINTIDNYFYIL